ncbi:helix-turn-helix transcriptional regulator [Paenibacillus alginolyticus]|uniref:helix-turn-helix domain-containing protein n=1 Tax=Paenibacillus alginolyticus TaxID=59839 RepID=UPI0004259713|nr:helix-turn-helix domain-containing protein [Paenibacillus alginolyticus]MCY9663504.1 helix-turn-helix transcriptional regulator [Paenibacillus alginolyticus]
MEEKLNNMAIRIHWINDKQTPPEWRDIRKNVGVHSFYWIREGKGTFRTEEKISIESGMLLYLKPGLEMTMEGDRDNPLRITMVLLSLISVTMISQGVYEATDLPELELPFMLKCEDSMAKKYDNLFKELSEGWVPGQLESELLTKSLLYNLLYELHKQNSPELIRTTSALSMYIKVKDELDRNYREGIRLHELADRYQISISYLRSLFQKHTGKSPKSYLKDVRNEHAKKQLLYTELSVKEIAENCGYADEFHFSKSFKQSNGMPPKQFRNKRGLD